MTNKLTKEEIDKIQDVKKLRKFLEMESDRGCCLLAVSFLDNEIKLLLEDKLIGTNKFKKALFNFNGPLGTFSSKIDLSFSIGLISQNIKNDIHLIRKIRNEFGHSYVPIDFNTSNIKNLILELKHNLYEENERPNRAMFINAVTIILAEISDIHFMHTKFREKENKKYLDIPAFANIIKNGIDEAYDKEE